MAACRLGMSSATVSAVQQDGATSTSSRSICTSAEHISCAMRGQQELQPRLQLVHAALAGCCWLRHAGNCFVCRLVRVAQQPHIASERPHGQMASQRATSSCFLMNHEAHGPQYCCRELKQQAGTWNMPARVRADLSCSCLAPALTMAGHCASSAVAAAAPSSLFSELAPTCSLRGQRWCL